MTSLATKGIANGVITLKGGREMTKTQEQAGREIIDLLLKTHRLTVNEAGQVLMGLLNSLAVACCQLGIQPETPEESAAKREGALPPGAGKVVPFR